MKIELIATPETITPKKVQKLQRYSPGFAESVANTRVQAVKPWGWCTVTVRVTTSDGVGEAHLGLCSYLGPEDFVENSGYFSDLVREAMADINSRVPVVT